jgi:flagellar basal-body rod protein FlgB
MAGPVILDGIATEMHHLAQRQRVIAQNIANSETPGFKARDVAAPDFADLLAAQGSTHVPSIGKPTVQITSGMAALGARPPRDSDSVLDRNTTETKPDGNNVTLEDQLLKMGQIQADFTAMTNLYRRQQGLLKSALGHGGS